MFCGVLGGGLRFRNQSRKSISHPRERWVCRGFPQCTLQIFSSASRCVLKSARLDQLCVREQQHKSSKQRKEPSSFNHARYTLLFLSFLLLFSPPLPSRIISFLPPPPRITIQFFSSSLPCCSPSPFDFPPFPPPSSFPPFPAAYCCQPVDFGIRASGFWFVGFRFRVSCFSSFGGLGMGVWVLGSCFGLLIA